jgi:chromosome segregation ATPase
MSGRASNGATGDGSAFATAAAELTAEVHRFESLTERLGRLELASEEQMTKAADILSQAAQSHLRFVELLRAVVTGVEDARRRQNQSAVSLSNLEEGLNERRSAYEALRARFEKLGEGARELRERLGAGDGSHARERLDELIAAARDLAGEARSAELVDLEREGHAMYQQLEALSRKLARVPT